MFYLYDSKENETVLLNKKQNKNIRTNSDFIPKSSN